MNAYIINLDAAEERWAFVQKSFAGTQIGIRRVPAIDGYALQLPIPEYAEATYRRLHGRPTAPGHVGCYLSHVKAMEAFLATDEPHAIIAEDDLTLRDDFKRVVDSAMKHAAHWNVLRLSGLGSGRPAAVAELGGGYELCVNFARMKGTGAYVIDRQAARALAEGLLPMCLPIDHAMDREWRFGLRAACVLPFPASQLESGFRSSIQRGKSLKLPAARRWLTTYPYQIVNELSRWCARGWSYLALRRALRGASNLPPAERKPA